MAKTVFGSHEQTAHVWAQGRGGDTGVGRSSDDRIYFDGRILYSYGRHFALGLVVVAPVSKDHPRGEVVATLLNSSGYSPSTGKHKNHARSAARGTRFDVPDLTAIVHTLNDVTGPYAADHKALAKVNIARHIAENYAKYTTGAAAFVYGLAGGTAKQSLAIITKAGRAAAKAHATQVKTDNAELVAKAKRWAGMDDSAFREAYRLAIGDSAYSAPRRHDDLLADLRKCHKAASAAGLDKVKAKVWARIKGMPAMGNKAVAAATVTHKNRYTKQAIRALRQYLANLKAAEPKALNSTQWGQVWEAASALANRLADRPSLAGLMVAANQLADHADAQKHATREEEHAAARIARAEQDRIDALEEAEKKALWLAGSPAVRWRGKTDKGGAFIRALHIEKDDAGAITGGLLQTSQGADVPLSHALRAFRFIKLCRAKGEGWQANGRTVPVGHFRIDSIAANGDFVAGCHRIEWEEVERLATSLGIDGWQGDESAVVHS